MVTGNEYKTDSKAYKWMMGTAILLAIVILINIGLYFYNSRLQTQIIHHEENMRNIEQNISELQNDEKVKLYTILNANKNFLEVYEKMAQVPEFINNLKDLSKNFKISFLDFNYSNSVVNTTVIAQDDAVSLAYQKWNKFIANFRNTTPIQQTGGLLPSPHIFSLNFVNQFEWQNEIKFNIWLKLK